MTEETAVLARLEANVQHMTRTLDDQRRVQDERWIRIEPLLLARSGELVRADEMKGDLNAVGNKVRALDARVSVVEKRVERTFWVGAGVVAILQLLAWAAPYAVSLLAGRAQ